MTLEDAIEAYDRGEYDQARFLCLEALRRGVPAQYRVLTHLYLGNALAKLGDLGGANEQLRQALTLEPSQGQRLQIHYQIGVGLRKLGDRAGARAEFQRAIEQFREPASEEEREQLVYSLLELALLEYEREDHAAALSCVERAAQVPLPARAENREVLLDMDVFRGRALFWLKRWSESIPVLRKALAELPETDAGVRTEVTCLLGLALCSVREYDEAFELLRTASLDHAKHPGLWAGTRVWLGNLYYRRDEYAKALEQFEPIADRPAEEWAGSRESLARMADCYLETGQPERGLVVAEKAYRELRGNGLVHIAFAKALALAARYQEAEQVLRELDEAALDDGLRELLYAHSAYVAVGMRDREQAEEWLRMLTALNLNSRYLNPLRERMQGLP